MQEIVTSVQRVSDIMGEISAASAEQNTSVGQIGQAVSQIDQVTQHNAALVEESAAAATSLQQQAQQLVQAVAVFQLSHDQQAAPQKPLAVRSGDDSAYTGVERRGPNRANNVTRLQPTAKPVAKSVAVVRTPTQQGQRTGTHDWENF